MSIEGEILSKIQLWETGAENFLGKYDEYASNFRLDDPKKSGSGQSGFTRTKVAETTRATMAIATAMYRMMTQTDPFFELIKVHDSTPDEMLSRTEVLIRWQLVKMRYKRHLLRSLQGLSLFGSQVVEEPWSQFLGGEGTDFFPRSLLQFAFDPGAPSMELSDFYCTLDYVTPHRLMQLARKSPETWDGRTVEEVIAESKEQRNIPETVRRRLNNINSNQGLPTIELATFYGPLEDFEPEDGKEPVASLANGIRIVRKHGNPFPGGRPFRIGHYIEFELNPYGLGVGKLGRLSQKQLDGNRNRTSDLITASLLNMWLISRASGVNPSKLNLKMLGVIEGDDISEASIRPLRPAVDAANYGIQLDRILKEELQGATGATPGLQALTTDATATESSIAFNEGIRRVAVPAEIIADEFVREHLSQIHRNNVEFLDTGVWAAVAGHKPVFASRSNIERDVEFFVKIATDKDFRPQRLAQMLQLLFMLTSVRNQIPQSVDPIPVVKEIVKAFGMNPNTIIRAIQAMPPMPKAVDQLEASLSAAQNLEPPPMGTTPEPEELLPEMGGVDQGTGAFPMGDMGGAA